MAANSVPAGGNLRREIGFLAILFTSITGIIGSGWLFASLFAAQLAGPAAIFSWLIGGGIALSLAFVYAELGGALPVAGALARIPFFSHGNLSSFMAGWLCWLAYVTIAPIEVMAALDYATNYLPWLTLNEHGDRVLTLHGLAVAAVLMLVFTGINLMGVKWLAESTKIITLWKIAIPVATPIVLITVGFNSGNFFDYGGFAPHGVSGVLAAVSGGGVMFSFLGFRAAIDMAGEVENPQRNVPLAIILSILLCLVVYVLLQMAFIGVIPSGHLVHGWGGITENVHGGPFAAFAALLGLQALAFLLYFDAILSPSGTALSMTGVTARINYAMSKNGQLPKFYKILSRTSVPVWSLIFNFVMGMIVFLPLPGWSELVGFISSAAVLSFIFGPVSLVALRHQAPDLPRSLRLPYATPFSALCFIFGSFVVYWSGWDTNWVVFLLALSGLGLFALTRFGGDVPGSSPVHFRESAWIWPYMVGMALISWLGNFGHGKGLIPAGLDHLLIALFSIAIFMAAVRLRLSDETVAALIAAEDV